MITTQRKIYSVESFSLEAEDFFKLEFSTNRSIAEFSNEELFEKLDLLYHELEYLFVDGKNTDATASTSELD